MKKCEGCREEKPTDEFAWKNRKDGVRQGYCKACKSKYNRAWYQKNKEKHMQDVEGNRKKYHARNRQIIDEARSRPCLDCGGRFPVECMDFDHLSNKLMNVSDMLVHSEAKLREEMAKCEVVCANCHRIRTKTRLSIGAAS